MFTRLKSILQHTRNLKALGLSALFAVLLSGVQGAQAALYDANPANFGTALAGPSDCDDCSDGPFAFGAGHSINFFGTTYTDLYVGSNGYVTFGAGASAFSPIPLDQQAARPMIAAVLSDLDSRSDATSQVFVNTSTPGQIVVTWFGMGHWPQNYTGRSTFQLVIRSDQLTVPGGQGQIGFFYGTVADTRVAAAGFGDGLAAVNPGEVAFHNGPANELNDTHRWYNLNGGIPTPPPPASVAPIPTLSEWSLALMALMALVLGAVAVRRVSGQPGRQR